MSLPPLDPIPQYEAAIDGSGRFAGVWYRWLSQIITRLLLAPIECATPVHRTDLSASIVGTTLFTPSRAGDYVVRWAAQITTPASVSSSLAVTISWTSNAAACSKTFTALTGNTTGTADGDAVSMRPDSGTAVKYATTYASSGTAMAYMLDVWGVQDA